MIGRYYDFRILDWDNLKKKVTDFAKK